MFTVNQNLFWPILLIGLFILIPVAIVIPIIASWKLFTKAGEPGWKALIPYYSTYTLYKVAWKTMIFWIMIAISVVIYIVSISTSVDVSMFTLLLGIIVTFVISILLMRFLAKSYGKGIGFTFGLVFLPLIFLLILAFGRSEYIGPMGVPKQADVDDNPYGTSNIKEQETSTL